MTNLYSKISFAVTLALLGVFLTVMWFPAPVDAQFPTQLVPECGPAGDVQNVCSICHIFQLVDNILKFIFAAAAIGAIVMLIYGGFLMILPWADPNRYTRARKVLTNAFIGVLIIFFSWLLIDTIIKILAQQTISPGKIPTNVSVYGPWNEIPCDVFTVAAPPGPPSGQQPPGPVVGGEKFTTQAEALQFIKAKGLAVNTETPCPEGVTFEQYKAQTGGQHCSTWAGVKLKTIEAAVALKNACKCAVTLTAGSEAGHALGVRSHATGDKIDIDSTPALLNFIKTTYEYTGTRARDNAKLYKSSNGIIYAIESNHVDILTPL